MQLIVTKNTAAANTPGLVLERTVCEHLRVAGNFITRMVGLLGARRLDTRSGLWITPSSGVHTFGMRFAIDVVALDERNRVLRVWKNVVPQRLVFAPKKTRSVLELAAGTAALHSLCEGDTCRMTERSAA